MNFLRNLHGAPLGRKPFVKAALLLLTAGKALSAGTFHWAVDGGSSAAFVLAVVCGLVFFLGAANLASRRMDAMGLASGPEVDLVCTIALLIYWKAYEAQPFLSVTHYAVQALLLLVLTCFPDKPVSASGYARNGDGVYAKPRPAALS